MPPKLLLPDAGPLIGLSKIGQLGLLRELYSEIVTTDVVRSEVQSAALPDWIRVTDTYDLFEMARLRASLDPGESSVIALASEYPASVLGMDDLDARKAATARGYQVIGTAGILAEAFRQGLIDDLEGELQALKATGFWISDRIIRVVLESVTDN